MVTKSPSLDFEQGLLGDSYEWSHEILASLKNGEFVDYLSHYQLLNDAAPSSWLQWRTQEFFFGGVQQIQLRTQDREDGDLGAQPPSQGFWRQL